MTKDEVLKLALEAMEYADACLKKQLTMKYKHEYAQDLLLEAGTAIKEALAQPEQEPVAIVDANDEGYWAEILPDRNVKVSQLLYATPPQRKPLTDEERLAIRTKWMGGNWTCGDIIDAVEAAHGIKGEA